VFAILFSVLAGVGTVVLVGGSHVAPAPLLLTGAAVTVGISGAVRLLGPVEDNLTPYKPNEAGSGPSHQWPPPGFVEFEVNGLTFFVGSAPQTELPGWRGWFVRFRQWNQNNQHWLRTVFAVFALVVNIVRILLGV
jgi:hypothetical protein